VFPVRYELNSYIKFRRNSVFKGLTLSFVYERYTEGVLQLGAQENTPERQEEQGDTKKCYVIRGVIICALNFIMKKRL
jgi:hypothetical protein